MSIFRNLILIASLAFNGIGLIYWVKNRPKVQAVQEDESVVTIHAVPAVIETLLRKTVYPGTLYARKSAMIISDIQGRIASIHFKNGAQVKEGQLLVKLKDDQVHAEVQEAKARFNSSALALKRQKNLGKYGTKAALEKAQAEHDIAKAQLKRAQAALKATRIVAPFSGNIGIMALTPGAQVTPNQELTKIVSQNGFTIHFQIPEADSLYLKKEQEIDVWVKDYDSLPVPAHITAIEPYSNQLSHTVKVEALLSLDVDKQLFHDGSYAKVELPLQKKEEVLTIPKESLLSYAGEKDFVYVVMSSGNKVSRRQVFKGMIQNDRAEIKEGLKEGEMVALDPDLSWGDQHLVKIATKDGV